MPLLKELPPGAAMRRRPAAVAVAATSAAAFDRILSTPWDGTDLERVSSVLVIGVARLGLMESYFAPSTGFVSLQDLQAEALRDAQRAAGAAAISMPIDVESRHCACFGWRGPGLRRALQAHGCASLLVDAVDVRSWRHPGLRRCLADIGVAVAVAHPTSTGGGAA